MALNKIFQSSQRLHRVRPLSTVTAPAAPSTIQPGTPVLFGAGATSIPAVSLTASGNGTKTVNSGLPNGITSLTYGNGGVGLAAGEASFAYDGTWEFLVGGTLTNTASDVEVFITSTGTLTLTAASNTHFGYTDYPKGYTKEAGRAPVRIGK